MKIKILDFSLSATVYMPFNMIAALLILFYCIPSEATPHLDYSTFLPSSLKPEGRLATDPAGNMYVVSGRCAPGLPVCTEDIVLTKIVPGSPTAEYQVIIGGNDQDQPFDIALDSAGNIYIAGETYSTDLATPGAFQTTLSSYYDAFVMKLDPRGNLLWSTYLGGSFPDTPWQLEIDSADRPVVVGTTGRNFPLKNPIQNCEDSGDLFITKLTPDGSALEFSTCLGGSYGDGISVNNWALLGRPVSAALDEEDAIYVYSSTLSPDLPVTTGAYLTDYPQYAYQATFLAKISPQGDSLEYLSYFGGNGSPEVYYDMTWASGLAVLAPDQIYIVGATNLATLPVRGNPYQTTYQGEYDIFIAKLNLAGNGDADLIYCSYLGAYDDEYASDIILDENGYVYIAGGTQSGTFFPWVNYEPELPPRSDYQDFLVKMDPTLSSVIFSQPYYPGGPILSDIDWNPYRDSIYGTGEADPGFPVTGNGNPGDGNAAPVAVKISIVCPTLTVVPSVLPKGTTDNPYNQNLQVYGATPPVTFSITSGNLPPGITLSSSGNLSGKPTAPGIYNFQITATDLERCSVSTSYSLLIECAQNPSIQPEFLPNTQIQTPYQQTLTASKGTPPYTFSLIAGNLPPGINMDPSGLISGIPSQQGIFNFTIAVADQQGCNASRNYTITVYQCLFCDDFEDNTLDPQWSYLKPSWEENNGNLIGSPISKKAIVIAQPKFSGCGICTLETVMTTSGGTYNKIWFSAWYIDKKNTVELIMNEQNDKWILQQRVNGEIVRKTKAPMTILPQQPYTVTLSYNGSEVILSVNQNTIATLQPEGSLYGTTGFQVKYTTATFAKIAVY